MATRDMTTKRSWVLLAPPQTRTGRWRLGAVALCVGVLAAPAGAQQGGAAQGRQIASSGTPQGATACIGCHGAKGEGSGAFPRLAGAGQAYLQAQLEAFASGTRRNPVMQPIAQKLDAAQRQAVAAYYSQLPAPAMAAAREPDPSDPGAWLAARGRWTQQLPACGQCHGADGAGVGAQFPPLAGLPQSYIVEQLAAWKSGARPPGPLGLMPAVAAQLSDADAMAVARYYAGLAVQPAGAGQNKGAAR